MTIKETIYNEEIDDTLAYIQYLIPPNKKVQKRIRDQSKKEEIFCLESIRIRRAMFTKANYFKAVNQLKNWIEDYNVSVHFKTPFHNRKVLFLVLAKVVIFMLIWNSLFDQKSWLDYVIAFFQI